MALVTTVRTLATLRRRWPRSLAFVAVTIAAGLLARFCLASHQDPGRSLAIPAVGLEPERPGPSRPPSCVDVPAGAPLQQLVDQAASGAALCLAPGRHAGPLRITRPLTLFGPRSAVIHSTGHGTTIEVQGAQVHLLGFSIDGSGGRYDLTDAALHVQGEAIVVDGLAVRRAMFGITVDRSHHVTVRHNDVLGDDGSALGLRGDSIRLWETHDSVVEGNRVHFGRDLVFWYSSRNRIAGNVVQSGRYGAHLMYSHDNQLADNRFLGDVVGLFIMYSRNVEVARNLLADSSGGGGLGLGIKESGNITVVGNRFLHNTTGAYLDTTPLQNGEHNRFEGNLFHLGQVGVVFHGQTARNHFFGNSFRDNRDPVRVEGGGDALAAEWLGNDFDDYAGYDLDGDGHGDMPYALRSLAGQLTARCPEAEFFRGSPSLALVDAVGRLMPLAAPKTILVDPRPRLGGLRVVDAN